MTAINLTGCQMRSDLFKVAPKQMADSELYSSQDMSKVYKPYRNPNTCVLHFYISFLTLFLV